MDDAYEEIALVVGEQNEAANFFAKMAHNLSTRTEFHRILYLPVAILKLIFLDRIGIPSFRSACK